jgi:GT2 family glycosyltransferase
MTTVPTFCFVIPCFNDEDNVAATVGSVREGMDGREDYENHPRKRCEHRSYLKERCKPWRRTIPIRVIDNPVNLGFSGCYKRGAKAQVQSQS